MPKNVTGNGGAGPEWLQNLDGKTGADIPDRDPLLPVGKWRFDLSGYRQEDKDSDNGEYTKLTLYLEPSEVPEDVEENGIDWTELRQYYQIYLMRPTDARKVKRFAAAFGVDVDTLPFVTYDEDGKKSFPMIEAAKGESGIGTVSHGTNSRSGEKEVRFSF